MESVKIKISGAFWDSQIYSGELILFTDDGSLRRLDWRAFIDSLADSHSNIRTALRVSFIDGELFYNDKVRKILLDPEIAKPIRDQLKRLSLEDLWIENQRGEEISSPFDFVPTDTEVYYNNIIASGDEGLYSCSRTNIGRRDSYQFSEKHHDARFLQVKASDRHTAVAAAAGSDGLIEFSFEKDGSDVRFEGEKHLSERPCSACEWAFQNVVGWTDGSAFLANFNEEKKRGKSEIYRIFDRVIDFSEIFGVEKNINGRSFSWGSREKFYRVDGDEIIVVERRGKSSNKKKKASESSGDFEKIGSLHTGFDGAEILATGTAPFGSVVELPDRLVVVRSDGKVEEFFGELVHWRIFPRSSHYSNQLHLIYENYMEVVSFVHDYFVEQFDKNFGFSRSTDSFSKEVLSAFS
ncbi:hypothetical protein QYY77_06580 [Xanthomonas campestris pv. campestris]|uniref:hypothetical protein n=1 Tax=Xanthomonas campestris TaxID=339 RepID=UPI002AD29AAF|nr:hypothetical protein [Xanthomonas campestris]MEA0735749.1 hypothetical protein [Xanthomonas campestris pv. campestris]